MRTRRHKILIDGCLGEDKTCRWYQPWHRLRGLRFLSDLATVGLAPGDIDFVMCTHLHGDHVGWNTRLVDGRWVPTFPKARYVISRRELEWWKSFNAGANAEDYEECIDESVLPVVEAGQALLVAEDHAIDDEVWLEPLLGHTPGHFGVRLKSNGAEAIMIGDLMHCPVQCPEPDWNSSSDFDPDQARRVRRRFLESHAEIDRLVLTSHFPSPSVGHIRRHERTFRFQYIGDDSAD
ncbi:MAG: MBL fold metallo-hydrolase [Dongiaceae bacterium]